MPTTFKRRAKLRARRYDRHPWTRWLAQDRLVLLRGVDYAGESYTMAIQLKARARACGRHASVRVYPDRVEAEVRDA